MIETRSSHELQLEKLLSSVEFQSSRQLRLFLEYTAGCVLKGASSIDQFEIAEKVLGKADFDPTIDASVRKLATQVRQRLAKYYEGGGAADSILITIPLRSYLPQFSKREPVPKRFARPNWILPLLAALLVLVLIWWLSPRLPEEETEIRTSFGDIKAPHLDPGAGGLRLGPVMAESDEIMTRLSFSPSREGQYAGILIWAGPLQYVALGRRFSSRNHIALSSANSTAAEFPDVEGQSGVPVWLRLRREGDQFTGWVSADGSAWTSVGKALLLPLGKETRSGLFAINGRRDHPSIAARFALANVGSFSGAGRQSQWHFSSTCSEGSDLSSAPLSSGEPCESTWAHSIPAGPSWSFTTRVDCSDTTALSLGLYLRNQDRRRLRLVRYRTDISTIALIEDGRHLLSVPDYPGRPPVYLRIRREESGQISALRSLDGLSFEAVGKASGFSKPESIGLIVARRETVMPGAPAMAHFLLGWQDLWPLKP